VLQYKSNAYINKTVCKIIQTKRKFDLE